MVKKYLRAITNFISAISFAVFFTIGYFFISGQIPGGHLLYYSYFGYAVSAVFLMHFLFFGLNEGIRGRSLQRKIPKYLEYAYAILISASLMQIFFSAPRIIDYIQYVAGDEEELVKKIGNTAKRYMQKECPIREIGFTVEYCNKVKKLSDAKNLREYVTETVLYDAEFLNHTLQTVAAPPSGIISIKSPIQTYAFQLLALREYTKQSTTELRPNFFPWIALLLLPIGIALRLVKTSLELFGNLDNT